jgi:hypothetical protein
LQTADFRVQGLQGMKNSTTALEPATLGPNDPPIDFSREQAAYEKEKDRLVREHPGWIALIHGDEVAGAFPTADQAILESFRRFGMDPVMLQEIRASDLPEFVPLADTQHPSFKRVD